jgi:hypothetical protein
MRIASSQPQGMGAAGRKGADYTVLVSCGDREEKERLEDK